MPIIARPHRTRHGRALIECVVASMLLTVVTLAVATTTRGSLALVSDATLVAHAQALGTSRAEASASGPCQGPAPSSGHAAQPGVVLDWVGSRSSTLAEVRIDIAIDRSPLAFNNHATPLALTSARLCP